ncbi:MAG: phosphatidylserine/phosphatidylglycerophosphate/cardiolipin synthase family protein [Bdellovibrionales bacterium]
METKETQKWDREEVFYDGEELFQRLCHQIDHAQESIEIEVYIFQDEEKPRLILEKMIAAAHRGVKVRFMVDGIGSFGFSRTHLQRLRQNNVKVRIYHPTPWDHNFSQYLWWVRWKTYLKFLGFINRRNHRKVYLFDQKRAIVSSSNLTQVELIPSNDPTSWRETSVYVEGEEVSQLHQSFQRAWKYATGLAEVLDRRGLKRFTQNLIYFNFTRKQRRKSYIELIYRIYSAQKKIGITNAYFVPDGTLIRALRYAAWTGVEVYVLVPHKSDLFFMRWVTSAFYFGLLLAGVKIFEYVPRVLHAKSVMIDHWGRVGTSNLNHRSLFQDLEVDVVITQVKNLESLSRQFEQDLKEAKSITMEDWLVRPRFEKWMGQLLLKFRYWL